MAMRRSRTPAVEVGEAKAFVEAMEAVSTFHRLEKDWAGPGTKAPRAPAIATTSRLMKDRQSMATRLTVAAGGNGDIRIHFRCGANGEGDQGYIHVNANGRPAIVVGEDVDEDSAERHAGVATKDFRKQLDALISPRTGKYRARKFEMDGIMFDSEQEARRYRMLSGDAKAGLISDLIMQVSYEFIENGRRCFIYRSDFNYTVTATGEQVIEDVKGMPTDVYKLKKKLIEARFGITITEWPVSRKELARRAAVAERESKAAAKERDRLVRGEAAAAARKRRETEKLERAAARAAAAESRKAKSKP